MGKNHRHKKNLKADKAKVQLKQTKTKFLPKGLNVTDPSFKIKPIVLLQQLKFKDPDAPLSRRKLNVKDLLSRMKHYNENVRYDACEDLSEMLKLYSNEIIGRHLGQIILSVSSLMQDKERKVRKVAANLINFILEMVPEEKLQTFYNYFSINLRCAMTNIDRNVQEDSLLFLDSFLKNNCSLISINAEKLLPDFFTLISKIRSDSNLNRTLTINLISKMTSVTWRIRVLSRLYAVLLALMKTSLSSHEKMITDENIFECEELSTFPIYKKSFRKALESSDMSNYISSYNNYTTDTLNKHIVTLVPLLYETFIEVVPEKKKNKSVDDCTVLTEESAAVLSCVMSTLYLLWKYTEKVGSNLNVKDIFLSNEGKKFFDHLLANFPFIRNERKCISNTNQNIKILDISTDSKCSNQNVLICYVYSILNVIFLKRNVKKEIAVIIEYICKFLLTEKHLNKNVFHHLIEFLRLCLVGNVQLWRRSEADLKLILKNTIVFYGNVEEEYKMELFNMLLDVINNPFLKELPQYKLWLTTLPEMLCTTEITDVSVLALLKLSRNNIEIFHTALMESINKILGNLNSIKIVITAPSLLNNEDTVKRNIVNIFYYVPILTQHHLQQIRSYVVNYPTTKYSHYFSVMLSMR